MIATEPDSIKVEVIETTREELRRKLLIESMTAIQHAAGQWFACVWGDNCVTTQHLGDATIYGPFATEDEAAEYVA